MALVRKRQQLRPTVIRRSMVAPCEWAHHVVEDDRHAVVQQRLAEHQEVEVSVHSHLNTEVVIIFILFKKIFLLISPMQLERN